MDRNSLLAAGPTYTYLRGLLAVPIGAFFLLSGATHLEWGPFGSPWLLGGGTLACLGGGYGRPLVPAELRPGQASP